LPEAAVKNKPEPNNSNETMHLSLLDSERKIHMSEMQNHTVHFSFDTTPEQAAIIQQKMKNAGFRAMVLNGYLLRLDLPELREASRQMSILSNNVNQIAKRMNEHGSIYETEIDEILEKQEEITQLIRQIYERLEVLYE